VSVRVRTSGLYKLVSALAAFLLWGGWAWYVNGADGEWHTLLTALAQGTSSFLITLVLVALVTRLYHAFEHPLARLWLPSLVTVALSVSMLFLVHLWVGTGQILYTILPPSTVAFLFCLFTTIKIQKSDSTGSTS
jgi:hypothetical protein